MIARRSESAQFVTGPSWDNDIRLCLRPQGPIDARSPGTRSPRKRESYLYLKQKPKRQLRYEEYQRGLEVGILEAPHQKPPSLGDILRDLEQIHKEFGDWRYEPNE